MEISVLSGLSILGISSPQVSSSLQDDLQHRH